MSERCLVVPQLGMCQATQIFSCYMQSCTNITKVLHVLDLRLQKNFLASKLIHKYPQVVRIDSVCVNASGCTESSLAGLKKEATIL